MDGNRARGHRDALFSILLLLLASLAAPAVTAQDPPDPSQAGRWFGVVVTPDRGAVHVPYMQNTLVNLTLLDVSKGDGEPLSSGRILLQVDVLGEDSQGWEASLTTSAVTTRPGQTHTVGLFIEAGAIITEPTAEVLITARYDARIGQDFETNLTILAVAQPNPIVTLRFEGTFPEFSPDEEKRVGLTVTNQDYYPNMILFDVQAPEGWIISPPSSIQLGPGEERQVFFDVKAPQDPWFRLNPTSDVFLVTAETSQAGGNQHTVAIPTPLTGYFLPGWVMPHIVLFFLGAAVLAKRSKDKHEERKLEKGKPSYPGLPVEKEAELEALKQTDPDKAERMEERLKELHGKRLAAWKQVYKQRKEKEKELRERERERHDAILREQKKQERERKKAEKARRKKLAKLRKQKRKKRKRLERKQRKAEKRAAKARREEEKRLAKQMRKKEKQKEKRLEELEEKRAKLRKEQEKQKRKELETKRKRLEKLRKKKERGDDSDSPAWKFWRT